MRRPIKIALITAAPIALLNLPPTFAIDVGLAPDANWFDRFIADEWVVIHWPGLWLTRFDPYYNHFSFDVFLVFLSGYVEWAMLLIAVFYCLSGIRRLARGLRSIST